MAKTQGHGNPAWTRDETILALALYFETDGRVGPTDERVVELSALLRKLPYHVVAARQPTFRNPAGVAFKIQNLRQVATGKGLGNVSQMDRDVWLELGAQSGLVSSLAALIRSEIDVSMQDEPEAEPEEFFEGRLLTRLHTYRERHPKVRAKLIESKRSEGLSCEICDAKHDHLPPDLQDAAFEAHHVVPE
jgi:5-methylcytosine-specific restriction protein A